MAKVSFLLAVRQPLKVTCASSRLSVRSRRVDCSCYTSIVCSFTHKLSLEDVHPHQTALDGSHMCEPAITCMRSRSWHRHAQNCMFSLFLRFTQDASAAVHAVPVTSVLFCDMIPGGNTVNAKPQIVDCILRRAGRGIAGLWWLAISIRVSSNIPMRRDTSSCSGAATSLAAKPGITGGCSTPNIASTLLLNPNEAQTWSVGVCDDCERLPDTNTTLHCTAALARGQQ